MKGQTLLLACLSLMTSLSNAETKVFKVEISAQVLVYDVSDPDFAWGRGKSPPQVVDAKKLKSIDGAGPPERLADYLADGAEKEKELAKVVSGGTLKLSYVPDRKHLKATVTYDASRKVNADETRTLREYTYGQLLDGVGESFQQEYAERRQQYWIAFEDIEEEELSISISER